MHVNSIGQTNPTGPATTNLHQIHHDRDFASVVELFNIPLRDPAAVTRNQRNFAPST